MVSSLISRRRLIVGAGALALVNAFPVAAQAPLKVTATFSILADWVRQIGGDHLALTAIVPAGGDAHTFDPNPDQVASIADAALIFEIGIGFETWLDDMVAASGTAATRIVASDGVALLTGDEEEHDGDEAHHEDDGHDHGQIDPHIWGDVASAIQAAGTIRDALTAADPGHAAGYAANATAYIEALQALDTRIRDQVATISAGQRKLVTTHDTFGYYAHAYGFEIAGTALGSLSTEGGDPSARDIATLVGEIEDSGVPAIFAENVTGTDLMQVIADEAGVELAPPLYTDALSEADGPAATYIDMMTYNTQTIVTALAI
jgi:zinc/manganese transport system substrate-binding protein